MTTKQVQLTGQICVGGAVCPDPCAAPSSKLQGLALSCSQVAFQAVVSTDVPMSVATAGAVGAAWDDLPLIDALATVELLYVRTSAAMRLRIGAAAAVLASTGATLPLAGGETLITVVDGQAPVTTTFTAATTAQQVANEINAAAALLGQAAIASVNAAGAVVLTGALTGAQGSGEVAGGSGQAALGFAAGTNDSAAGAGEDVDVQGLFLSEFGRNAAPTRVQISGVGNVEVFAAGTPAS